jgi:hypothetical protein
MSAARSVALPLPLSAAIKLAGSAGITDEAEAEAEAEVEGSEEEEATEGVGGKERGGRAVSRERVDIRLFSFCYD